MVGVVQAYADELADPPYRRTQPHLLVDQGQGRDVQLAERIQTGGSEVLAGDIVDDVAEVANTSVLIQQSRTFASARSITQ
jgi:hypothetical protein